jgi:hypothetical protein
VPDPVKHYLTLLGELDPVDVLRTTPVRLKEYVETSSPVELDTPYAPGKWCPREVLAHLADVETVMGFRLRQLVAAPGIEVQPFDQDAWARRYGRLDPGLAVEAFAAQRAWNLALIAGFSLEDWLAEAYHPERGFESADLMVRMMAGHDINHLAQLGL